MANITKLDMAHAEGNFISQIADLKKRIDALERQAIKLDENDYVLPVGGINVRNGFLTLGDPENATIVDPGTGGMIAITRSYVLVDTEGGAGADNLDRIEGGVDGALLVLQQAVAAHVVTVREVALPGNLLLSADRALNHPADTLTLIYNETLASWCELSNSNNA